MPQVTVKTASGADAGTVDLDDGTFGIEPNVPVMHQVVTAQLAARRAGTQSTKTRAEVAGGGAKPWKQKGTGRARQGSIRAPQWRGGGVALGPKPRSYRQRTPKKMIKLALRSALSDRAADGKVLVVDEWGFAAPRTKDAAMALGALGVDGRALVVVPADDRAAWLSFRNLPTVHVISPGELNAYDVLVSDYVVFTRDTLPAPAPAKAERSTEASSAEAVRLVREAQQAKARAERPSPEAAVVEDRLSEVDPEAAVPSTDHPEGGDVPEGEDDMADDLPNRPKPSGEAHKPIKATDRVKSVSDKEDPRFAAARDKADKEDRLRAAQAAKKAGTDAPSAAESDGAEDEETEPKPKGGFSFNMTVDKERS
ncbi:MAG: 50S ribosomal protein L4 [Acidimicrobiales bacterium]